MQSSVTDEQFRICPTYQKNIANETCKMQILFHVFSVWRMKMNSTGVGMEQSPLLRCLVVDE